MLFGRRKPKARAYVIEGHQLPAKYAADATLLGARARQNVRSRRRVRMCATVFGMAFVVLGMRLSFVTFSEQPIFSKVVSVVQEAKSLRPEILDRNGKILATNLPMISLEIAGSEVWDPAETTALLATAVNGIDAQNLEEKLRRGRYVEVASNITPALQRVVFDLGLPGIKFQPRFKRYYPQRALAAHTIGHMEPGKGGVMGMEAYLNSQTDAGPLKLSLDIRAQQALEVEIAAGIKQFDAVSGWAIVMDVMTGEIIAATSQPDFDPNEPGSVDAEWRRNKVTYDRYELGSAFKALSAASVLDAGIATEATLFDARGSYKIADKVIRDFHGRNRLLTLSEVIQYSSNIGMVKAIEELGVVEQKAYLEKLGLFEALSIDLIENRSPQLPRKWGPVEAATVSYGHGIAVTPLHLISAFVAVVNGGHYVRPTFLKAENAPRSTPVFSEQTSQAMRKILRRVITDGTASKAEATGYFPIGKTATADKPLNGRYSEQSRIASFIGAFPGYDPKYALLVTFDEPQPTEDSNGYATAGWNAAPTFSKIVNRLAPILSVMPERESVALAKFYAGTQLSVANDVNADEQQTLVDSGGGR